MHREACAQYFEQSDGAVPGCETIGRATEWIHVISKARVVRKFPLRLRRTGALFRAFQALGAFRRAVACFSLALSFNPHSSDDSDSGSIPSFLLPLISHSLPLTTVIPFHCSIVPSWPLYSIVAQTPYIYTHATPGISSSHPMDSQS